MFLKTHSPITRALPALLALLLPACKPAHPDTAPAPHTLILISIDAMRYDYLDLYKPPVLTALAQRGTRVTRLISCFPTSTFPNHYSIATGLYPAHHGIVSNTMYDPETKTRFTMATKDPRWWLGDPIWNTAERQHLTTACNFWPGSEIAINNHRPAYWLPFEDNLPLPPRIAQTLAWLDLPPEKRPTLITLYFSDVDHAGHTHGPDSPETRDALLRVDAAIGQLLDGLRARRLLDTTNLIILSDHGMAPTSPDRTLIIENFLPDHTLDNIAQVDTDGPYATLRPLGATTPAQLRDYFRDKTPHLAAHLTADLPARFHYSSADTPRIPPVILLPADGWRIVRAARNTFAPLGDHGYDPAQDDMAATLIAAGPDIKKAHLIPRAENTDIYNLLCALLHIRPAPNDGTPALADEVLAK